MKKYNLLLLVGVVAGLCGPASLSARAEVFAAFDGDEFGDWTTEGEAFGNGPLLRLDGEKIINSSKKLACSAKGGAEAVGTLVSPEFTIKKSFITFKLGGGSDDKLAVQLLIDGAVAKEAGNLFSGGSGALAVDLVAWDVSALKGKTATLKLIDESSDVGGYLLLDEVAFVDLKPVDAVEKNVTVTMTVAADYLLLPVEDDAKPRWVELTVGGKAERAFAIGLASRSPDWWAVVDASEWKGSKVTLTIDSLPASVALAKILKQSNTLPAQSKLYKEPLRPQAHFSAKRGLTGNPAALIHIGGKYHMFYEHNPYGINMGTMQWGHAVSRDLLHWEEQPAAIIPAVGSSFGAGSVLIDSGNASGHGQSGSPMLLIYAAQDQSANFSEIGVAVSSTGTAPYALSGQPVLKSATSVMGPRVFHHGSSKKWVMLLTRHEADNDSAVIMVSEDMKNWTETQVIDRVKGPVNLFQLPVLGKNKKLWVLMEADGSYKVGTFNGSSFSSMQSRVRAPRRNFGAAELFHGIPTVDGRSIAIGCLEGAKARGMSFNQCMSLPQEWALVGTSKGLRLVRQPVSELEMLRSQGHTVGFQNLRSNVVSKEMESAAIEIRATLRVGKAAKLVMDIRGTEVVYDCKKKELKVRGRSGIALEPNSKGMIDLIIYQDLTSIEVFADRGLVYTAVAARTRKDATTVTVKAEGGIARIEKMQLLNLKSIWEK